MAFHFPSLTDYRIHPERVELSVAMDNGVMRRVEPGSEDYQICQDIIDAASFQRLNIQSRGAVDVSGGHYRLERMPNGFFAVRRLLPDVPTLEELNLPRSVIQSLLLAPELSDMGGVVLIVGKPGRGKSFTATSMVRQRLETGQAAYALTYENPPEFLMQGFHGNGYCDQNSIPEGEYAKHLSRALRCFPAKGKSILFAGEILDADSAVALSRVGLTGNLCISTGHGEDPLTGIERWLSLTGAEHSSAARNVIASSLRMVIYQDLIRGHDGQFKPMIEALKVNDAARSHIRRGDLHLLATEIENTTRMLRAS